MAVAMTAREQRIARVLDREVAPYWHDRFARLLFRHLPAISNGVALDIHCGSGRTTSELLTRLDDTSRVVALEPDPAQLALAKARVRPEWKDRVYFKAGDVSDVADMGENAYDITVANLVLGEAHDWKGVVNELLRVTKPGGSILATLPLRGTWAEVEDLFYEILLTEGLEPAVRRLGRLAQLRPLGTALAAGLQELGVSGDEFVIEQERFSLLFPSGREFLFAPLIEHGPLRLWKAIIGENGVPQELFWHLKEAIDTYYSARVFSVTVVAGLLLIRPDAGAGKSVAREYWRHYPELDALWRGHEVQIEGDDTDDLELDMDVDLELEGDEDRIQPDALNTEDHAIFAAMGQGRATTDEDVELERVLERVFELGISDSAPPPEAPHGHEPSVAATAPPAQAKPRLPPPPPTGPQRTIPATAGADADVSGQAPNVGADPRPDTDRPARPPAEDDVAEELSVDDIIDEYVLDPEAERSALPRDDLTIDDIIDEYLRGNFGGTADNDGSEQPPPPNERRVPPPEDEED